MQASVKKARGGLAHFFLLFFFFIQLEQMQAPPPSQYDGPLSLWEIRWAAISFILSLPLSLSFTHTHTHTHILICHKHTLILFPHLSAQWWRISEHKIGFCTTKCSWIRFIIDLSRCSGKSCSWISLHLFICQLDAWAWCHCCRLLYWYRHLKECSKYWNVICIIYLFYNKAHNMLFFSLYIKHITFNSKLTHSVRY